MTDSQVPDLAYPCVFHLNQAWQVAIDRLQTCGISLRDLPAIFAEVPHPRSYTGAVLAAQSLNSAFVDFGHAYDRRFHESVHRGRCKFDSRRCYEYVRVSADTWTSMNVAGIVDDWTAAFGAAFTAAHGRDVATFGNDRFARAANDQIARLAHDLACSAATFRRRFKIETGMRPVDARTRVRVLEAFVLLRTTTWKVDAIGAMIGWKGPKAIYAAFKAMSQMNPAAVRQLPEAQALEVFARLGGDLRRLRSGDHGSNSPCTPTIDTGRPQPLGRTRRALN